MKGRTEKQHYIPNKSYLDYFTDKSLKPPMLWVYFDKQQVFTDAATATPQNITPINFCKESYLYETPKLPLNAIENTFAQIEGNYKKVLDTKIIPRNKLTKLDRKKIAYFLSTLEVRTPLSKKSAEKFIGEVREHVQHLEEAMGGGQKSELHKRLDEMEAQNVPFVNMQLAALDVNRYLNADYLFLVPQFEDEKTFFLTSDFPVAMLDFTNMNTFYPPTPMDATVEVVIPLTPKVALLVNNIGLNGYKEIDHNFIREVNNRVLRRSNKFIISPQKLDEQFTKYNIKRSPQSFLLLLLSDKLRKKRHKKIERMINQSTTKMIKKIAQDIVNAGIKMYSDHIEEKALIVDCVTVFPQDNSEYKWLLDRLGMISKKVQEFSIDYIFQLNKPIKTGSALLSLVKVRVPDLNRPQKGAVDFKTGQYNLFKEKYLSMPGFTLLDEKGGELIKLTDKRFNILVYFPRKALADKFK